MSQLMHLLAGTWFVVCSNFQMWLAGDKTRPTFNYTIVTRKGETMLLDEVKYVKKGKPKTITGYDHAAEDKDNAFVWRGKGILGIASSKWEVRLQDPGGQWIVIWFSETLFTKEGVDIISRKPQLDENTISYIRNKMQQDEVLRKHVNTVAVLKQ